MDGRGNAIRVRAYKRGEYGHILRRVGDVFDIADLSDFNVRWMEVVAASTPLRHSGAQAGIDAEGGLSTLASRRRRFAREPDDASRALIDFDPFE
jgi:hypothetical protein